jgi:hypothetical protein
MILVRILIKISFNIDMLSIHCNKWDKLLGSSYLFCLLDNNNNINSRFIELTSKWSCDNQETLVTLLNKLVHSDSSQNEVICKNCLSPICSIDDRKNILYFKYEANVYFRELVYGKIVYYFFKKGF